MKDNDKFTLREYRPEDLHALREMVLKTIDTCYPQVYTPSAILHFKRHHAPQEIQADAEKGYAMVMACGGRIVGSGVVVGGKVTRVYVDSLLQGKGLGKRIMLALEEHEKAHGHRRLFLHSSLVAKKFYESLGYRVEAHRYGIMPDGSLLEYFTMAKELMAQ